MSYGSCILQFGNSLSQSIDLSFCPYNESRNKQQSEDCMAVGNFCMGDKGRNGIADQPPKGTHFRPRA